MTPHASVINRLATIDAIPAATNGHSVRHSASPFVDAESFESEGEVAIAPTSSLTSPFVQGFVAELGDGIETELEGERQLLISELHDDELESALYELAGEGARAIRNIDDPRAAAATLELTYAPLLRETDAALQRIRDRIGDRDPALVTESEIEDALGERRGAELTPAMEHFLSRIGRAVKKIASGAANLAKKGIAAATKLGLAPIIATLRRLLPKVLAKLVQGVIKRIPASLQPDARKLARALNIPVSGELANEAPEVAFDVATIQQEFNEQVADIVLSGGAAEAELEGYTVMRTDAPSGYGVHELDEARARFADELAALQDGEDPRPAVERFVPAILPALTLAKKLIGRKRVASLLTPMIATLIAKFVGPQAGKALSAALVDAGLKLVGFELPPGGERASAHEAIANTVEETVRRVAALPEEVLDNSELVEGAIVQEFERAAAANFPPLLPRPVYRRRPDLLEAHAARGVWVPARRRRFKKYSRVFRARITPQMAMVIPTFVGGTLAGFLDEQLGATPGEELEADVHLYEAMPGMLLSEVGEGEGEGEAPFVSEYDVHPLTSEAAALLLGEPGLGQEAPRAFAPARAMAVGQRFYRLAIPGRRVAFASAVAGGPTRRRSTHLRVMLDLPAAKATISLYVSERRAQEISSSLRARPGAGTAVARLRPVVERMLRAAISGEATGRVRILHPKVDATAARGPALRQISAAHLQQFNTHLLNAALGGVATFLKAQSARFIGATEDVKDGVTLSIAIENAQGMRYLANALGGTSQGASSTTAATPPTAPTPPGVTVDVVAGHRHD